MIRGEIGEVVRGQIMKSLVVHCRVFKKRKRCNEGTD